MNRSRLGPLEKLRAHALAAFSAAVDAAHPSRVLSSSLEADRHGIAIRSVTGEIIRFSKPQGRILLAALGKAGATLAEAWLSCCPDWAAEIHVLIPHGVDVPRSIAGRATVLRGAHPYPDASGEASARALLRTVGRLQEQDTLLVLLSGGTSALLAAPVEGLRLGDIQATTRALISAGAPIEPINTVRRQLLAAAGGGLARAAAPASTLCLVLSDVLGDPLESIGSGPTVPSSSTAADALAVLDTFDPAGAVPLSIRRSLEARTREAPSRTEPLEPEPLTAVIANNRTAVDAATEHLRSLDHDILTDPAPLTGEASARGRELARRAHALAAGIKPGRSLALVLGGETTVTVRGTGRGGRNQELALAAALELEVLTAAVPDPRPVVLVSAGTDGIDGLSPHAGALIDPLTCTRIRNAALDPDRALADNDSATALEASGDSITTGPTGTNVCDITAVLLGSLT